MDTFTELQQLVDDLTELGDTATAALVCKALGRFSRWEFDAGERYMEQALHRVQGSLQQPEPAPDTGATRYFAMCTMAVA
jgi:hypothetical protein